MNERRREIDVSIVIVSYNTVSLLERCLRSLDVPTRSRAEVIVVDNASTDGSPEMVRREFPAVRLFAGPENLGFARGVNRGVSEATGRYALLLNPDAALHRGSLDELVAFADRNPRHGIYGGRIMTADGAVDPKSCWGLPSAWSLFCFGTGLSTALAGNGLFDPQSLGSWDRSTVREVGAISGALMLVERSLWERLGGFDGRYFMYSEDIDLCARARELGHRPIIDPAATAVHAVGASSTAAAKAVMVLTGKATFIRLRWPPLRRRWGLAMLWLGAWIRSSGAAFGGGRRSEVWPQVWAQRRSWLPGYPPPDDPAELDRVGVPP